MDSVRHHRLVEGKASGGGPGAARVATKLVQSSQGLEPGPDYRAIVENARVGIFQTRPDGLYIFANKSLAQIYGYDSPDDLILRLINVNRLYMQPGRRETFVKMIRRDGEVKRFESEVFRRDGSVIWISETARVVRGGKGKDLYYEGTVVDITSRKRAELALLQAEERWRSLVDHSNESVVILSCDGRVRDASLRARMLFGVKHGDRVLDCTAEDDRAAMEEALCRAVEEGEAGLLEVRCGPAGGARHVWSEVRVVPVRRGTSTRELVLMIADVSSRKAAEEALKSSRHFSERIADTIPAVLYVYDYGFGRYVFVSDHVTKVLGYSPSDLLELDREGIEALHHPEDDALARERLRLLASAKEGDIFECEYRIRHANGEWRWFRVRDTVFKTAADGKPSQILGIVQDISERQSLVRSITLGENRFRELLESTNAVPWEINPATGCYTYVGPQALRLLGFPLDKWYEREFWRSRVHGEDLARAEAARTGDDPGNDRRHCDYRLIDALGRIVWVSEVVHFDRSRAGVEKIWGFSLEVTESMLAKQEQELAQRQLRALSAHLHASEEESRAHLAREIHDEFGQSLTGLKMDISWLASRVAELQNPGLAAGMIERLDAMSRSIDQSISTVRSIATELRPAILDHFGLVAAIEWQSAEFQRRSSIECHVRSEWKKEIANRDLSTALFRVFQEILTNAARHSGATRIDVRLRTKSGCLVLEVRDNGRGISPEESSKSLGILGMRERVSRFNGTLEISGLPNRGTRVRVTIPPGCINGKPQKEELLPFLSQIT